LIRIRISYPPLCGTVLGVAFLFIRLSQTNPNYTANILPHERAITKIVILTPTVVGWVTPLSIWNLRSKWHTHLWKMLTSTGFHL